VLAPFDNHILFVEGPSGALARLANQLRQTGFDVERARTPAAGLQRARRAKALGLVCVDGSIETERGDTSLKELAEMHADRLQLWITPSQTGFALELRRPLVSLEPARDEEQLTARVTQLLSERLYPRFFLTALKLRTRALFSSGFGEHARPLDGTLGSPDLHSESVSAVISVDGRALEADVTVAAPLKSLQRMLGGVLKIPRPTRFRARDVAGEMSNGVAGIVKSLLGNYRFSVSISTPQCMMGKRVVRRPIERPALVLPFELSDGARLFVKFTVYRFDSSKSDAYADADVAAPGELVFL
jgi:CheY-specific phosphatase CheX